MAERAPNVEIIAEEEAAAAFCFVHEGMRRGVAKSVRRVMRFVR
jgi:hypothetical protein